MTTPPPIPWQVRHEGRTLIRVHMDHDDDGEPEKVTYREENSLTRHTVKVAEWWKWAKWGEE